MTTTLPTIQRSGDPVVTVLRAAGRAGVAVLLWGLPGIGKSSLFEALAHAEGVHMETVLASLREPADFAGLPVVTDAGVSLAAPAWANRLIAAEGGYLFLDELTTAPPAVQAAALRVVLDRVVGEVALPRGTRVVAAANPPESAADGWDLPAPQANRFLHIDFSVSTDDWIDGMVTGFRVPTSGRVLDFNPVTRAAMRAEVASFIRTRPELLHAMPAGDDAATGRAWPSNRTWTMLADTLAFLDPADTPANLLAATGLVGEGAGTEFLAWRVLNDLPDPADVLADPASVPWADLEPSRAWATLTAVTAYATADGTKKGWLSAWAPLAAAALGGLQDVAAANARALLRTRPTNTNPPASAKAFLSILGDAGLIPQESAA